MRGRHWAVLVACLASVAMMGGAKSSWSEVTTPMFVFGAIGVVCSHLGALFTDKPRKPLNDRRHRPVDPHRPGFKQHGKWER